MGQQLRGAVVVITGASSGIGHATALEFARRGARLVVAARREESLEEVARECRALGAEGLVVALAARSLGCDRSTVENSCHRYPRAREALWE